MFNFKNQTEGVFVARSPKVQVKSLENEAKEIQIKPRDVRQESNSSLQARVYHFMDEGIFFSWPLGLTGSPLLSCDP
jgi:hypothetical protein